MCRSWPEQMRVISMITCLAVVASGCLRGKRSGLTSDAGIVLPQSAIELGIDSEFMLKTYSQKNLDKRVKDGQLVVMVKSEWRDSLPLKHRSGDVKTYRNSRDISSVRAMGDVEINGMTVSKSLLKILNQSAGSEGEYEVVRLDLRDISSKGLVKAINTLHSMGSIVFAEPNFEMNAIAIPNDPKWPSLWGMEKISVPVAWDTWKGDNNSVVAVLDTGIDYKHEDLKNNMWINSKEVPANNIDDDQNGYVDDVMGWNFFADNNNPMDGNGHGTHCAGIIAAKGNNEIGITGLNWNAKLMPIKVLGDDGSGYNFDVYDGIMYAVKNGAKIISNSYGGGGASSLVSLALTSSRNNGVLFVAAAGNESVASANYPAYYSKQFDNVISVAATDQNDSLSSFSNYGDGVNTAAPGRDILSTVPNNGYQSYSGTSLATPHVAGLATLLWSNKPNLTYLQIKDAILTTGDAIPGLSGKVDTGARINALSAIEKINLAAKPTTTPTPTVTATPLSPTPVPSVSSSPSPTVPTTSPTPVATATKQPTVAPTNPVPLVTQVPTASTPSPSPAPTSAPSPTPGASTPTPTPAPDNSFKSGIRYSYFTSTASWNDIPDFGSMTPRKTGLLQNFSLSPRAQSANYGLDFSGFIKISKSGTYTFYTTSDDGSRLWINGTLVVENGGIHLLRDRAGTINLQVGYHPIRVEYFQSRGAQYLDVSFKGPGIRKQKVPNSFLFYK